MKLRNVLLAASLGIMPAAAASAQDLGLTGPSWIWEEGLYVGALGGFNVAQDADLKFSNAQYPGSKISFSNGWAAIGRIGYRFGLGDGLGLSLEGEGSYRKNDIDSVTGNLPGPSNSTGDVNTWAAMVNILLDYNAGWIRPYIGAGAGYAWTTLNAGRTGVNFVDDTQGNFAYQGIVGAHVPIDAVPGLMITAEARYFATLENNFDTTSQLQTINRRAQEVDITNENWTFLLGVTYAFGAILPPPPAPAPAAAPAPARTYLVFFDFDRADLTDRARQIIAEAAANAGRVQTTRIEVTGHTDTVGTAAYNQGLSVRRANAVARELEARGIPRSQMSISGVGFSQPLVPTGPNVREPQNRRVEIVLR